jgi:hypothetical protein
MSIGSWFRTHKRQIITHTSIIVGFVLFIIFATEPLFDRLERVPGEAQLCQLQLPAETNNIRHAIDCSLSTEGHAEEEIRGWAFVEGQDSKNRELYIVLKSAHRTYVLDSQVIPRMDLIPHFGELCLNVDYSGFTTLIPARKISNGEYTVGIYIRGGDIQALQYTDNAIVKAGNIARLTVRMSEVQEIPLPPESGEIRFGLEMCEVTSKKTEIAGWAFIDGQSAEDSKIYVVLKSEKATYVFDTVLRGRPDVTAAFAESGLNLDYSGFFARIPVDTVEVGTYELGIYIKKGDIEALQYIAALPYIG